MFHSGPRHTASLALLICGSLSVTVQAQARDAIQPAAIKLLDAAAKAHKAQPRGVWFIKIRRTTHQDDFRYKMYLAFQQPDRFRVDIVGTKTRELWISDGHTFYRRPNNKPSVRTLIKCSPQFPVFRNLAFGGPTGSSLPFLLSGQNELLFPAQKPGYTCQTSARVIPDEKQDGRLCRGLVIVRTFYGRDRSKSPAVFRTCLWFDAKSLLLVHTWMNFGYPMNLAINDDSLRFRPMQKPFESGYFQIPKTEPFRTSPKDATDT